MEETKVIFHIDDENTPYLIKLPFSPEKVCLADLKNALNKQNHKYFFKSMDDDFGFVKEEIVDDSTKLPYFNGKVVCWLVAVEGSASDNQSQCTDTSQAPTSLSDKANPVIDGRNPTQYTIQTNGNGIVADKTEGTNEIQVPPPKLPPPVPRKPDDVTQSRPPLPPHPLPRMTRDNIHPPRGPGMNGHRFHGDYHQRMHSFDAASSMLSSDLETTSFLDSEDDSRFSTASEATSMSSRYYKMRRPKRPNKHRLPPMSRTTSISSITDSTMSLNIITVTLNMDTVTFLGISIVGQSNRTGDGGIYVGSIMKGGAVALDGRIEPGDMILEVNGVSFENMSNDDAVRTLRESVQKPGPITLVVAKCWDPNPKGYMSVPHQEAVRPIDPSAWVAHTEAARHTAPHMAPYAPSMSTMTSTSSSLVSSLPPEPERIDDKNLTTNSDMAMVVRAMAHPESGLEIRDRMWLKITIPSAFIGSELVDWLYTHVQGFANRNDARKYASSLVREGFVRHAVNKTKFSEQCYYVFGDAVEPASVPMPIMPMPTMYSSPPGYSQVMSQFATAPLTNNLSSLALEDIDSVSEVAANKDHSMPSAPTSRGALPVWPGQYPTNPYLPSYLPPMAPPMARNYALPVMHGYDPASYVTSLPPGGNMSVVAESVQSSAIPAGACACLSVRQLKRIWSTHHNQQRRQRVSTVPKTATPGVTSPSRPPLDPAGSSSSPLPSGGTDSGLGCLNRSTSSSGSSTQSSNSQQMARDRLRPNANGGKMVPRGGASHSGSDTETGSIVGPMRTFTVAEKPFSPPPASVNLAMTSADLAASRQSFKMAMGNAYTDDTLQCMGDL